MKDRFPLKKEIICRCTVKQLIRHLLTLRGTRTGSLYMVIGPNQKTSLIPEVSGDHFGVYECEARNNLGTTSMKMRVSNGEHNRFFFSFRALTSQTIM